MKKNDNYPLTVPFYEEHHDIATHTMLELRPHGDGFVGLAVLMSPDMTGDRFDDVRIGDRLSVACTKTGSTRRVPQLTVGSEALGNIGEIPFSESILPGALLHEGENVYCFVEAKSFRPDDVRILVSIYAEY